MGKIEIDHTGSGSGITLSSDGTDLLLDGSAVGGSEGAGYPADQSFTVTNSGSGAYTFAGGATGDNATLTLIRGRTYKFAVNASGHPFYINTSNTTGTGAAYVNGTAVINNGAAVGDIYFTVPDTAPATLYYNCQYHSSMAGTINVSNAMVVDKTNNNLLVNGTVANPAYSNTANQISLRGSVGTIEASRDGGAPLELNRKTSDGDIVNIRKDGNVVGSIGTLYGDIYVGTGDVGLKFTDSSDVIVPLNTSTLAERDASVSLGQSGTRFKDLYLSDGIYLGGTGSANKLDDYEEGTFTPSIVNGWGILNPTYSTNSGFYTKVGNIVHIAFRITLSGGSTNANGLRLNGLPFTVGATTNVGTNLSGWFATASSNVENVFLGLEANDVNPLFYYKNANGTSTFLGTDAGTSFSMTFSGTYQT